MKNSLMFVAKDPINNIQALVQIVVVLMTHIRITRPQWVKNKWSAPLYALVATMAYLFVVEQSIFRLYVYYFTCSWNYRWFVVTVQSHEIIPDLLWH